MNEDIYTELYDKAIENNKLLNVNIELLTKCNWRCVYCYIPKHNNKGMDKNIIFNIFKQLREMGVFEITLTGGEIFLRNDIIDIILKAREMGFNLYLYTNVSLLNERIIKKLSSMYISRISCTIFSLDKDIHDSITGVKGSLYNSLKNINLLKKYNIPLELKVPITKLNNSSYKEIENFCKKNDFYYKVSFEVFPKSNGDKSPCNIMLSGEKLNEVILYVDKLKEFKANKHNREEYVCQNLKSTLSICCNGDVYPCNKFFYKVGNIYEDTIKDIWYNSKKLNKIKEMKWKDLKECFNCEINEYCMRCPGIALLENNSILAKSNFACKTAKARFKNIQNCKLT